MSIALVAAFVLTVKLVKLDVIELVSSSSSDVASSSCKMFSSDGERNDSLECARLADDDAGSLLQSKK